MLKSSHFTSPDMARKKIEKKFVVDFKVDDYSTTQKLWDDFKCDPSAKRERRTDRVSCQRVPRRSLLRQGSIRFDYFEDDGYSPLMRAVNKNFVKTVFNLLLVNSDPNLQFEETGETALHMAVANINVLLVKALLAFDADPDIKNNSGETPLDIAISIKNDLGLTPDVKLALGTLFKFGLAEPKEHDHHHHHHHHHRHNRHDHKHDHEVKHARVDINTLNKKEYSDKLGIIIDILIESNKLRAKTEKYFSKHSTVPEPQRSSDTFMLSMDGGGMRVLVTTQILVNIEERMSDLASTSVCMYKYFDYIVGTSAGGQTACALAYLKADTYNVRAIMSRAIYVVASAASERKGRIEETFQQTFSKFLSMADIEPTRRVIVTASMAHVIPFELHLMTSYGEPRDGHAGPKERKVWEACHISGAAPYYSPLLFDLKLLDGGLVANNPTLDGMAEIIEQGKREGKPVKFGMVLSLGTGFSPKERTKEVELFGTSLLSLLSPKNIHAMESLASHFASQSLLTDGTEVHRAKNFCDALGCQYFRVTPPLKEAISMATTDEETLINMMFQTQMYLFDNPELIDNIAKSLLSRQL